jgi:multiple sugar transport system substrate-binding protein
MDAFDAAGIPYPSEEGWTWEEFLEAAEALTLDEDGDGVIDQWGFWMWRGRYAQTEGWVYQNNGSLLNEDKTRFAPDENAVEALDFLTDLISVHEVAPPPSEFEGIRQQDVVPLGFAAMFVDGNWQMNNFRAQHEANPDTAFRFAAAPIPRGPQWEEDTAFGWADMFGIAADTEHPQEAWHLVKCITGPQRTLEYQFAGKIPVYRPTAEDEAWLELDQMPPNKQFLLDWAENIGGASFTPGWSEWRGYTDGEGLEGQIWAVQEGDITLEEALENTRARANEVLRRFYPEG